MLFSQFELPAEPEKWLHERNRFAVLEQVFQRTGGDCTRVLSCGSLADELGLSREEVFRVLHDLELRGFLAYIGSGPRVRLTSRATQFLADAGRRRSVRDAN